MTTSFERSAIIGYFRSGADLIEIADIMNISHEEVYKIIKEYLNTKS